ncbi:MAG TPA: M43 family zinc metalloprotease [Fluviicola sp.]|nr:M43 family zinc metalloprotease [Fluviicola sp.]
MYKKLLLGGFTSLCLFTSISAIAQGYPCGASERMKQLYAEDPQLELDRQLLMSKYLEVREDENGQTRQVLVIPVVFHIIHQYGPENISDAQVMQEMQILNEDFSRTNPDTVETIPLFKPIAGNAQIEFRLARLDPYGNCTNGIEHIYSHLTDDGDDFCKVSQWNRSEYLNIWVVKSFTEPGLLGYSFYPTAAVGGNFFRDGVIMLHSQIGTIGTAIGADGRTLTHEIGHYLGLSHTWGDSNDPEVVCGDDDVLDTPITKGHFGVCPLYDKDCDTAIVENVQNFMEYSQCSTMFTEDQATFMHNVLLQETSGRNNLYTEANLALTGVDQDPAPTCIPVADFSADKQMVCVGDPVHFDDASWKATVTDYLWSFPGGTPSTSTAANPTVVYNQDGYYSVSLIVSNANGSDTMTFPNMIYASAGWPEFTGPYNEDFESGSAGWWHVQNPENNWARFQLLNNAGRGNSKGFKLNNYKDVSAAEPFTNDWFYYDRLGNSKDYLISPSFDLSHTSNVTVSFDYAYGTKATTLTDVTEQVKVYTSRDCGQTWQLRSNATVEDQDIITAGYVGNTDFAPAVDQEWKTQTFTYATTAQDTKLRFRFEFIASDKSSNFYFDNFNISGTLAIAENDASLGITIAPNPVAAGSEVAVEVSETSEDMELQVVDINGALISVTQVAASNGTQTVMIPMNVAKGCYFINAVKGNMRSTNRVIVF